MNERSLPPPLMLSIAAVERDTGLTKDTLRVWERRYGFPQPERDQFDERLYPLEQVEKLRVVRRLLDQGFRPGKVVQLPLADLVQLSNSIGQNSRKVTAVPTHQGEDIPGFMNLIRRHQVEELRRSLSESVLRLGLGQFVGAVAAPLAYTVGETWARGQLEIFEEHLFTESMTVTLRNAINTIPQPSSETRAPRILLTTFPQESHGLGLLMAEAMFALEGCRCISLGVQTPILDIVRAATVQQCDIVALSFSACLNPNLVTTGLQELRLHLPPEIEIWAGGSCPVLQRRPPDQVRALRSLEQVAEAVNAWRSQH
ncbi:MerR family transcriptional regulator [Parvibium lacunae]|uniref:MerR family transcriptional regulator n=1 Tax=Parvibium lacunae TaxID=1888893 RepID=A0A368L1D6_9BURK|nr:MerR family transcriptional regulator [Parvibium lacunae]RCS57144.1 MerR family transcriptional regulator [Parvibium lacunae]